MKTKTMITLLWIMMNLLTLTAVVYGLIAEKNDTVGVAIFVSIFANIFLVTAHSECD